MNGDFPFVGIALMIFLAIAMFWGQAQYKKKKAEWGKFMTIVCGFLILIIALVINLCPSGNGENKELQAIHQQYEAVKLQYFTQELVKNAKGSPKVLIIAEPEMEHNKDHIANQITAIEKALESSGGEILNVVHMKGDGGEGPEMMEGFVLKGDDFNNFLKSNPGHNVIISLIGLPPEKQELAKVELFDAEKMEGKQRPVLGLVNGDVYGLWMAIKIKYIHSIVTYRPKTKFDKKPPPENLKEAFDKRFILITPDNLESVLKSHFSKLYKKIEPKLKEMSEE